MAAISDRTRKLLWGRSGGFYAMCRQPVTEVPSADDPAVVLGEECHLVSPRSGGPRYRPMPPEHVHGYGNLILLCPTGHARVDKQVADFTVEKLLSIKQAHEAWVARLPGLPEIRVRIRHLDGPVVLHVVETGQQLISYVGGVQGLEHSYPEPADQREAELLAGFLGAIEDWWMIWDELGAGQRVEPSFNVMEKIGKLLEAGFVVYCGRRSGMIEGGLSSWQVCVLQIFRADDAEIRKPAEPTPAGADVDLKRPQLAPLGGDTWRIGKIMASMGSKGDPWDNASAESCISTIKNELVKRRGFQTRDQARLALFRYIESFYNPLRRHSSLRMLSPDDYERRHWENNTAAAAA